MAQHTKKVATASTPPKKRGKETLPNEGEYGWRTEAVKAGINAAKESFTSSELYDWLRSRGSALSLKEVSRVMCGLRRRGKILVTRKGGGSTPDIYRKPDAALIARPSNLDVDWLLGDTALGRKLGLTQPAINQRRQRTVCAFPRVVRVRKVRVRKVHEPEPVIQWETVDWGCHNKHLAKKLGVKMGVVRRNRAIYSQPFAGPLTSPSSIGGNSGQESRESTDAHSSACHA